MTKGIIALFTFLVIIVSVVVIFFASLGTIHERTTHKGILIDVEGDALTFADGEIYTRASEPTFWELPELLKMFKAKHGYVGRSGSGFKIEVWV